MSVNRLTIPKIKTCRGILVIFHLFTNILKLRIFASNEKNISHRAQRSYAEQAKFNLDSLLTLYNKFENKEETMRKKVIAGNWKMNMDLHKSQNLVSEIINGLGKDKSVNSEVIVCPPFTSLSEVNSL